MLFVDLETTFLQKGYKRIHQQMLEIGMCCGDANFQALVNPVGDGPVLATLDRLGQDPVASVRFWTKLLVGKKMLNSATRRLPVQEQAEQIAQLLRDKETFLTPEQAIVGAAGFAALHCAKTWVAHNGKSFDFHILRAHLQRAHLTVKPSFVDSLPLIRVAVDLPSHSQPLVYKHLFKQTYFAHHALHDARALQKIWHKLKLAPAKTTT